MLAGRRLLSIIVFASAVAGCATAEGPGGEAPPPAAESLRGSCPDTVVVQMNWFPQAEHGGLYRMLGSGFTVDSQRKAVEGPLLDDGRDTGVRLQVRAGGPVTGFQRVSALMAADSSITLGSIATDEAVQEAGSFPTRAVFAPLDKSPQMIMWSPERHPDWRTIEDIGRTDTTVVHANGASYIDYLVHSGKLKQSQVDGSYDGSPARFVSADGAIAQQGYATNEPYRYEHEVEPWKRPVTFALVHDSGYPIYPEALAVSAAEQERLAPCLRRLVPMLQRSTVAYIKDPGPTNDALVRMVRELNAGTQYSVERARYAQEQMRSLGLSHDGVTPVVGDFDLTRVGKLVADLKPLLEAKRRAVKADLKPEDVVSNEFISSEVKW
ncbi:ABC transporter substrate-binding protein [Saccharothrix sp.]|uniref:ABC transporter substrate-binding protein n=1 Tax=Saccharothrix sp. TaxID=1873460 RepID=UPI002810BCB0|nr:ABC transporter substrate-binding protein [Saccharothrix sp.]